MMRSEQTDSYDKIVGGKMETVELVCPHCGAREGFERQDNIFHKCSYCNQEFVIDIAERLGSSGIEEEKLKELANLNKSLTDAVRYDDKESIIKHADEILKINGDDYRAKYYVAYARAQRGQHDYIMDFYKSAVPATTAGELDEIIGHIIRKSDLRHWREVEDYMSHLPNIVDSAGYIAGYKKIYDDRVAMEDKYFIYERDVFICHSSRNKEQVDKIYQALRDDGYQCWISSENLRPNDSENYWTSIRKSIEKCKMFLVVYSMDAKASPDVGREIQMALEMDKPRLEINIDATEHTTLLKKFFDGITWISTDKGIDVAISELKDRMYNLKNEVVQGHYVGNLSLPAVTEEAPDNNMSMYEDAMFAYDVSCYVHNGAGAKEIYQKFVKGANAHDEKCFFGVFVCKKYGWGVEKDESMADALIREHYYNILELANSGDSEAMVIMSDCSRYGYHVMVDKDKAKNWMNKAEEAGNARAIYRNWANSNHYWGLTWIEDKVGRSCWYNRKSREEDGKKCREAALENLSFFKDRISRLKKSAEGGYWLSYIVIGDLLFNWEFGTDSDYYYFGVEYGEYTDRDEANKYYDLGLRSGDVRCNDRFERIKLFKTGWRITLDGDLLKLPEISGTVTFPDIVKTIRLGWIWEDRLKQCEVGAIKIPKHVKVYGALQIKKTKRFSLLGADKKENKKFWKNHGFLF